MAQRGVRSVGLLPLPLPPWLAHAVCFLFPALFGNCPEVPRGQLLARSNGLFYIFLCQLWSYLSPAFLNSPSQASLSFVTCHFYWHLPYPLEDLLSTPRTPKLTRCLRLRLRLPLFPPPTAPQKTWLFPLWVFMHSFFFPNNSWRTCYMAGNENPLVNKGKKVYCRGLEFGFGGFKSQVCRQLAL